MATAAASRWKRQETRGMLGAIAAWPEVADVRMYERTVCPVFETKSSSNSGRSDGGAATERRRRSA